MADIQANIGINLDTSRALAQLKNFQRQISVFNAEIARGGGKAAAAAAGMQQELANSINATGQFSASMTTVRSTTESFTNALEKNKLSFGETFRYAGASTKKFSHLFTSEFNTIEKVARERVKTIQTQFIKMGRDANGAIRAIAVRPLSLDMNNLATQTAMAAQKQQILNKLLRQGSTNLLNWGKNTQWAGRQLMVGFTIPLTIFGAAAASSFMKLEEQAIRFKRVYGELFTPPEETDRMLEDIQKLALEFTKYGVAVEKTMALAADAAAMGRTGADLTAQVTEANRLAVLGLVEQGQALETTTSLSNAFGITAEDLASKIDFLNAVENQTVTSIEDLTIAIPKAGPVVRQLGGDVEDLAFFLTAMKEGGINASEGANALKSGLASLINPTQVAKDMLGGFGINITKIVESNAGNVSGIVVDFAQALDKLDPLNRARAIEQLFGKFQFSRISTLFQNVIGEGTQAQRVLELSGATAKELAALSSSELGRLEASSLYKFQAALSEFQAALAPVGEAFLKLVTPIIEFGTKVLNAFNNLNDGAKAFVVGIIATLGAIGPVLIMSVGLLANGAANLLKIFLGLQTGFQRILGKTTEVGQQTEYMTQEQLQAAAVAASLNQSHATLAQTFTSESAAVDKLVSSYRAMIAAQRSSLGLPVVASAASAKVPKLNKGRGVPGYKDGVLMVPGTGNKDTELALLTPGEAVIPAAMTEKYGPLINSMIADNIPGYQFGLGTSVSISDQIAAAISSMPTRTTSGLQAAHTSETQPHALGGTMAELASQDALVVGLDGVIKKFSEMKVVVHQLRTEVDEVTGKTTVYRQAVAMTAEELGEAAQDQILFATGATYPGTAILGDKDRNQAFNALGFGGDPQSLDNLIDISGEGDGSDLLSVARKAKQENSDAYIRHTAQINQMILEGEAYEAALRSGADAEELRTSYSRSISKQLIVEAEVARDGISLEEATQRAESMLLAIDREEISLREKRNAYLATAISRGNQEFVMGSPELGSDWIREQATGRGRRTGSRAVTPLPPEDPNLTGTRGPRGGRRTGDIASQIYPVVDAHVTRTLDALEDFVVQSINSYSQSSSPSRKTEQAARNLVDGAVKAVNEGQDDMQQAGSRLAEATEQGFNNFGASGTSSRTRGAPSRVRTAGEFTTPGQPLAFDIAGGKEIQAAQKQLSLSTRMSSINVANLAASAINGANKIGALGIGVSSLAGGLSMIEGPIGEFASKLFPVMGAITGLSFAMNFLNAETVKSTLTTKLARIEAVRKIRLERLTQASQARLNASTNVLTGATTRLAIAMNIAAISTRATAVAKGIGAVLEVLTGVKGKAGLVIVGLALLAGGVYLANKVIQDQRAKIQGLGDAANMSADRLKGLADALGVSGTGAREATIASAQSSGVSGTLKEQKEIVNTRDQFLELIETNDEFKKEWKGTVAALKGGTNEMAQATLEMLAVTLQTEGYSEEQISGIVLALQDLSGKTDVEIDFASININTQTGAIDAAAQNFLDTVTSTINDSTGQINYVAGIASDEALDALSASLASALINANAQFDAGIITLEQYETQLEKIRSTLAAIGEEGGLGPQTQAVREFIAELEAMGFEGITEATSGLVSTGTSSGLDAATSVAQSIAAGAPVDPDAISRMETGFAETANIGQAKIALEDKAAIDEATEAHKKLNAEIAKQAEITQKVEDLPQTLTDEIDAINQQSQAFKDSYNVAKNSTAIKNDLAVAEKIAGDEILRAGLLDAQRTDLVNGGTAAQEAFIISIDSQISAEKKLQGAKDLAALEQQIEQQKEQAMVTEGLGLAVGDSALAQEMMNNAQYAGIISSALLKAGFDSATGGAQGLATAMKDPGVLNAIALVKEAMDLSGSLKPPTGSGGSTPSSFLDDVVKGLRDVASGQTKVTEGFKSSLRALVAFSKSGVKGLNGLSSQLRKAGVTGTFAEMILGMDPKDWERQKKELFNFSAAGKITGLTAAGEAVQEALGVVEIGKFIDEQENLTVSVGHQIEALTRLTGAGASYEAAYEAVKNKAFAAAVATAKSSEQIQAAAEAAMTAMAKMKELEEINEEEERRKRISKAIREQNKEFSNQAKILDHINKSNYSEAQINEILNNKDLQSLVLEPSIDPGALSTALANAQKQADLELRIKKLTTEGQEDIFQEGVSNAMSAFGALEEEIDIEFRATIKDDDSLIQDAERQIALIDFELDDYQAGLDEIDRLEQDINDVYDKRIEALDEVATLNEDIARSQESQLEIADALSKGDIAAAARAAQQSRQVQQESAREAQQRMLEEQRASEISGLRSSSGMTREDLQDRIRDLEEQIFNIEEKTLEPAQERIRLAEITRDDRVADLQVLGKTREEWDKISNSVDVAQANGWRFADAMQEALNIVEKLVDSLVNRPLPPPPAPAPAPQISGGGGGGDPFPPKDQWKLANNQPLSSIVPPGQSWQQYYNENRHKLDSQLTPPAKKAYGGIIGRSRSGPPQQYFDGGRVKGPGTERSDSIPAMLSNGEYVIQTRAVRQIGTAFLDSLNGGKVVPQSKDGVPGYFLGGLVDSVKKVFTSNPPPKKYTPPVSIRQIERAASKPKPAPRPDPARTPKPVMSAIVAKQSAPRPVPAPASTPAVMTQDNRTPLKKAVDSLSNTLRTSGITNYIPNPVEVVKNIGKFFLPVTSSQVGSDGPSSVAPIRRGATDNSLVDDLLGMPFAGDIGLYASGSVLAAGASKLLPGLVQALRVPTVAVPGASRVAPGAIKPSGNTIVSPNATTIRQQQEATAQQTARTIDEKVAEGVATGQIQGFRDRLVISSYKKALVESDRLSSGPIMTPGQEILDNTTHISKLSPTDLLNVATAHVSKKPLDEIVNPYMIRTDNQRTFIASANPIENLLAKLGITTKAKREIEDNLRTLNTAPDFMTDPENAAILRNMISPQLGTYPKFVTGKQSSAFVSGSGTPNTLRKVGGIRGMSGATRLGPLSAFMGKQATREDMFILGHENAHIIQKLYERLGLRSPALPSPRDFNYGLNSNARLESGARLTDSLYDQAMGGTGSVRPYFPPELTLDNLVSMSLNSNTSAGRRVLQGFAKDYVVPNAPRGFQFNANWFEEYFAGISSSTIKTPHSVNEMRETLKIAQALRKAGLTNQTQPSERAGAMMRLVWNEISENGMVRPGKELMSRQMGFDKVISREAKKRSNRQKKTRSLSPSLAPRQSNTFLDQKNLKEIDIPLGVNYTEGFFSDVSKFVEDISGNKFFVKGHLTGDKYGPKIYKSFGHEFLAGRIGNMIGANTPQAYIVKRSSGKKPFEVATEVVPQSSGLDPTYMKELVTSSDAPYKTLDEIVSAFIDYSETTPALNAVMGNYDQHYNNILWNNLDKKFTQIDFGTSRPTNLKMAAGRNPHPDARDAYTLARTSIAIVRDAVHHSVNAAVEKQLLSQAQQLAIISKLNSSGFSIKPNRTSNDPLFDTIPDITTSQDYSQVYKKISEFDHVNQLPDSIQFLDKFDLQTIKDRAFALSELPPVSFGPEHHAAMAKRLFREKRLGFMAGGYVNAINTDRIPAMLTPGEYVVRRSAVENFGVDNLEKINNGTYNNGSMYNYNLAVNVKSDADPNKIARTVITNIKGIENQRVRGNRL